MSKYCTKASANVFYNARLQASKFNDRLCSREGAAEEMGIDRTRLARIELDSIVPYPEEVLLMADCYHAPELKSYFCRSACPLGKNFPPVADQNLDRITVRAQASFRRIEQAKDMLLDIAEDGVISKEDQPELDRILEMLDEVNEVTQSLKLWSEKHVE